MRRLIALLAVGAILSCSPKPQKVPEEEWRYLYDLGMSSFYAKNYSEAIANLYKASQIAPKEPIIWNALGLAYMSVEEYRKAEQAFKKALEANKDFSEAKMNLGILYAREKDYKRAIEFLQKALEDETFDKKHVAYYHLAKVYKEIGDKEKYMEYLRKATAYNPLFIEAQLELGSAYMDEKKYREAEKLYNALIENNFKSPEIYLSLAKLYYELGKIDKAKESVKAVLENKHTNNLQRTQAYGLLSKILIEEQSAFIRKTMKPSPPPPQPKPQPQPKATEKQPPPQNKGYGVQIAAFSSLEGAKKFIKSLKEKGLDNMRINEVSGIYKVIYGRFSSKKEAKRHLEKLKELKIYGFIVEVE